MRGGSRIGAGRKKKGPTKTFSLRSDVDRFDTIKSLMSIYFKEVNEQLTELENRGIKYEVIGGKLSGLIKMSDHKGNDCSEWQSAWYILDSK